MRERTKIVATLGPSCDSPDMITQLIQSGVNVFRLNFSHGDHKTHGEYIQRIRSVSETLKSPVAIMMDLQGPKIRTGPLNKGEPVTLVPEQTFVITTRNVPGDKNCVGTSWSSLPNDVANGDRILVSDGLIELRVEQVIDSDIHCMVVTGGTLSERQGINLPGVTLTAPALTDKDKEDLVFGLKQGIDYVALSFVRCQEDVVDVKNIAAGLGLNPQVIAKIERPEGIDRFPEILEVSDGIMIARGDLGVEILPEKVPLVQKQIIAAANRAGKPVITATQMLDSMIRNPRPTRAEASDVANAIIDGSDAVMLSGETATGKYPLESVRMMARIAPVIETGVSRGDKIKLPGWNIPVVSNQADAIADAACNLADKEAVCAIVVLTRSGDTARYISRRRPAVPIVALTPDRDVYRRLALVWGVNPLLTAFPEHMEEIENKIFYFADHVGFAGKGDTVLLVGGHPLREQHSTNFIKILTIKSAESS
jgi:pyruvate kinase